MKLWTNIWQWSVAVILAVVAIAVIVLGGMFAIDYLQNRTRGKSDTAKGTSAEPAKEIISLPECTGDTACSYPTDVDDLRVISHDANQLCLVQNAKGKLEKPEWDTCLGILKLREQIAMRDAQAALNRSPK